MPRKVGTDPGALSSHRLNQTRRPPRLALLEVSGFLLDALPDEHAAENNDPHLKMTKAQESSRRRRCAPPTPAIVAAIFLGLHILPLFWRPDALWGVDSLVYLPAPVQGAFILLSILLFIPGFRRQVRAWVGYLPLSIWGRGRRVWITRGLVIC